MAETLLDTERMNQAGLPKPRNVNELKRMIRSVSEEIQRTYNPRNVNDELYNKLLSLREFLRRYDATDKKGNSITLDRGDYYNILDKVEYGAYRKKMPKEWMYHDDGSLSPLEAVNAMDYLRDYYYLSRDFRKSFEKPKEDIRAIYSPEDIDSFYDDYRNTQMNDFFRTVENIYKYRDSLPKGLVSDELFNTKSRLGMFDTFDVPTSQQVMLDPVRYADHPYAVVREFARKFL